MTEKPFYLLREIRSEAENNYQYPQAAIIDKHRLPQYVTTKVAGRTLIKMKATRAELKFELDEDTKLTDIVSQETLLIERGLLVKKQIYLILKHFKFQPEIQTFDADVIESGNQHHFKWIHSAYDYQNEIDFTKTKFFIQHRLNPKRYLIKIKNIEDLFDKVFELSSLEFLDFEHGITLHCDLSKIDFFLFSLNSSNYFASERLTNRLKKENFNGFAFDKKPVLFKFPII